MARQTHEPWLNVSKKILERQPVGNQAGYAGFQSASFVKERARKNVGIHTVCFIEDIVRKQAGWKPAYPGATGYSPVPSGL